MRRSMSLRKQITILTTVLMLIQSVALIIGLIFSGIFTLLDTEAYKTLQNVTESRSDYINSIFKDLVKHTSQEADELNRELQKLANREGISTETIYMKDEAYMEAASLGGDRVIKLLQSANISGAFLIFEGSNARKENPAAHSAVYIRKSSQENLNNIFNYQIEVGPTIVAKQNKITSSFNWSLDMLFNDISLPEYDYYSKPMMAGVTNRKEATEQYGYWSKPQDILGDNNAVVTYSLPLINDNGVPYAVLGIEMSGSFIAGNYLPVGELPYNNSFYIMAAKDGSNLLLDWYLSSRPITRNYLTSNSYLHMKRVELTNLYEVSLSKLEPMYCDVKPLNMYGANAIYSNDSWYLVSFAPQSNLKESSIHVTNLLVVIISITTLLSFLANFFGTKISMRKISGLSEYLKKLGPYQEINFKRTGMSEIDNLMTAVEKFNQDIKKSVAKTSHIFKLTSLPIGAFEVRDDIAQVILTDFVISLLHLETDRPISKEDWEMHYKRLTENPLSSEDDIYEYRDSVDGRKMYLQILENTIDTGKVGVVFDVTKDVTEKQRLAYMVDHDELTQLYSREAFKRRVYDMITANPDKKGFMLFSDLDNLKYINDNFGHDVGDEFIKSAARMYSEFMKENAAIARISGDEFAVYTHGFSSKEEMQELIKERFTDNESFTFATPDGVVRRIRSSTGIAWFPEDSRDVSELLKLADYAMYEVKHSDKGGISEFNRSSYHKNAYLLDNRDSINVLLDERRIRFAYQPIVDLKTGEIFAYEMLMRPTIDDFKSPLEVLTVARNQSKLGKLEKLIMFQAFESIRANQEELKDVKLFINSIPSQILPNHDLEVLKKNYSDLFHKIVIEVIEIESESPAQMQIKIDKAREMGMMLAIDDFGSGYSNEMRILSIQPEIIKIDMEMVQGVHKDPDKEALIANLLGFCQSRGSRVIAEGIEDAEDLKTIIKLGVDFVQGYYTGKPNFEVKDIGEDIKQEIRSLQIKDKK